MTINRTIHLQVVTFDPKTNTMVAIPNAKLRFKDKGPLEAEVTTAQPIEADGDGRLSLALSYADDGDGNLKPAIKVTIPAEQRQMLSGEDDSVHIPANWRTNHEKRGETIDSADHLSQPNALQVIVGLPADLKLSYADFHHSGARNIMALPEHTLNIHMADEDWTGCFSFLNPEDKIKGKGATRDLSANQDIGVEARYPYYDSWPTAPRHETSQPAAPKAWIDPPEAPTTTLGTPSFSAVGPMTVDREGFVFLIDDDRVHRFYPDGTLAQTLSGLTGAAGLAIDRQRRLYVTLEQTNTVRIFALDTSSGELNRGENGYSVTRNLSHWGLGLGPTENLIKPRGICVIQRADSTEILAVTTQGQPNGEGKGVHVFKIQDSGLPHHRHSFAMEVAASNIFDTPQDVAGDHTGRLFVADPGKHRVWRFDLDNPPAAALFWGKPDASPGANDGEFNQPGQLVMDEKSHLLYVVNSDNRVVRVSASSGNFVHTWQPFADPFFLALDPRGDLYVAHNPASPDDRRIQRFTVYDRATGSALANNADPVAFGQAWTPISHKDHLNQPQYLHLDRHKRLWVCDTENNRVLAYTRDEKGHLRPDPDLDVIDGLTRPLGVTSDEAGNLYISEPDLSQVRRFDAETLQPTVTVLNSGKTQGLAIVKRGGTELLICPDPDADSVAVVQLDGTAEGTLTPSAAGAFDDPWDAGVDSQGAIYIVERSGRRLLKLPAGADWATPMIHVNFSLPGISGNPLDQPCGVWCDEDDHVYITDRGNHVVFRLGDSVTWWNLENLLRQSLNASHEAPSAGTVSLVPTDQRRRIRDRLGNAAWLITGPTTLNFTPEDGSASSSISLPVDSILRVEHNEDVVEEQVLAATPGQMVYEPELVDNLLLWSPCKAVVDDGLMMVAEAEGSRLRLLRIHTNLRANLLDLDERFPDLLTYTQPKADWREELDLRVTVRDRTPNTDAPINHKVGPEENFDEARISQTVVYHQHNRLNEAANAMATIRKVQRWQVRLSRMDEEEHRWSQQTDQLLVDITVDSENSHYTSGDELYLAMDTSGKGSDAWDDSVIAHEFSHWIASKSITSEYRAQMNVFNQDIPHWPSKVTNQVEALVEGFASYHECFWHKEYSASDRTRGNRLDWLDRLDDGTSPRPRAFDAPNSNLVVEGYFTNTMYQLHQMLVHPAVIFSDSPDYWYRYNYDPSDGESTSYSSIIRHALRMFPSDPTEAEAQTPVNLFLHNLHDRILPHAGLFLSPFRAICELNNLLMPVITLKRDNEPVTGDIHLSQGDTLDLVIEVRDPFGSNLSGYQLEFNLTGTDANNNALSFSGTPASFQRGHISIFGVGRITESNGTIQLQFTAPNAANTWTLNVSYESNFYTDTAFNPPTANDDLALTERKLYLNALRYSAGQETGAEVTQTINLITDP